MVGGVGQSILLDTIGERKNARVAEVTEEDNGGNGGFEGSWRDKDGMEATESEERQNWDSGRLVFGTVGGIHRSNDR